MHLAYRLTLCALLLAAACGDNGTKTTTGSESDSSGPATTDDTTTTTTTSDPTTSTSTTEPTGTSAGSSSTGMPPVVCESLTDETACKLADECEWATGVAYTHGTQGCLGNIRPFCLNKSAPGGLFFYWREEGGDIEVIQFGKEPTGLGPEWSECDCNGPLACLCTPAPLDCPDRLEDFCGTVTSENACTNAAAGGNFVCGWFNVSPEGPNDTMCTGDPKGDVCLPGTNLSETMCEDIFLPYMECMTWPTPIYWRDKDGIIEVTPSCGPEPVGWTKCVADDPNQPEECKCRCL